MVMINTYTTKDLKSYRKNKRFILIYKIIVKKHFFVVNTEI